MVSSVMTELELICFAAERQTENLMAQTDAEDWNLSDHLANLICLVFQRLRVAGSIRKKDAVGMKREYIFARCIGRNHRNARADLYEMAKDIALDSKVVSNDVKLGGLRGW